MSNPRGQQYIDNGGYQYLPGGKLDANSNRTFLDDAVEMARNIARAAYGESYENSLNSALSKINTSNLSSIEALPYQFLPTVDRRINQAKNDGTADKNNMGSVGRKYAEKILTRMPLLFLMPCTAKFMAGASEEDTNLALYGTVASIKGVLEGDTVNSLVALLGKDYMSEKTARYYGTEFAFASYYEYLQIMLASLANYLGIEDKEVYFRGEKVKIGDINWADQNKGKDDLAMYFSGEESLAFYMDGIDSVSETFSNDTTMPSIASEFNSKGEEARQMRFLFGNNAEDVSTILGTATLANKVKNALTGVLDLSAGQVSESLTELLTTGTNFMKSEMFRDLIFNSPSTILQGGRLVFPEIWNDSSYSKSYNISIKLRSPDHDTVSIFMNILVPYCKLLALTLPHTDNSINITGEATDTNSYMNPNTYFAPFLVKAFSPGSINIDMGIIDSLSITRGATCQWNSDGLPTQMDIDVSIKDLYHSLAMSGWGHDNTLGLNLSRIWATVSNTAYMDFLANLAGLNVKDTHRRKVAMAKGLLEARIKNTGARIVTNFTNKIANYVKAFYDW